MVRGAFKEKTEKLVGQIPSGKVMTYGQIAALIGHPRAARQVGGVAHFGDIYLPWHRVVNRLGGLASGYPGGREAHKQHLEQEHINFTDTDKGWVLDLNDYLWHPGGDDAYDK